MLTALKRIVIFYLVLIVSGVIYFEVDGAKRLRLYLEKELTQRTGYNITIASVGMDYWKPLSLELNDVAVKMPASSSLTISRVTFRIPPTMAILEMAPEVRLTLQKPKLEVALGPKETKTPSAPGLLPPEEAQGFMGIPPMTLELPQKPTLAFRLTILDGMLKVTQAPTPDGKATTAEVSALNFNLQAASFHKPMTLEAKAKFTVQTDVERSVFDTKFSTKITWLQAQQTLSLATIIMQLGTFRLNGDASLNLGAGETSLKMGLRTDDLSALPLMIPYLPFGTWTGAIDGSLNYAQTFGNKPSLQATFDTTKVRWAADWKDNEASLNGPVGIDLKIKYETSPTIDQQGSFIFAIDSSGAQLKYKDFFNKPKAVGLKIEAQGKIEKDHIFLEHSSLLFSSLLLKSQGRFALDSTKSSNLSIQAGPSSLTGLEKFIPVLASAPIQGNIEGSIFLEGALAQPSQLMVKAKPLSLTGLNAMFQIDRQDLKVKGPVMGDIRLIVDATGPVLQNAEIDGSLDLSGLDITYLSKFSKPAKIPLRLRLLGKKIASDIVMNQSYVDVGGSRIVITGNVQNPAQPKLNLTIQAPKLDLLQYSKLFPVLQTFGVAGSGQLQARIHGEFFPKLGFMDSPISIEASMAASLPNFVVPQDKTAVSGSGTVSGAGGSATTKPPEPLLTRTKVIESLKLSYAIDIGSLQYNDLNMRGVSVRGTLNNGVVNLKPEVKSLWEGSARTEFRLNVFESLPKIEMGAQVSNIRAESTLAWLSPEWKDLLSGFITGTIKGTVPHPKDPIFLTGMNLEGTADLKNAILSTLPLRKMIEEKLSAIPGVGQNLNIPANLQPGEITSAFKLSKGVIDFSRLLNTQPDKSELDLKGTVALDKTVQLAGEVRMTSVGIGGSFRTANSDAKGRLVVPLQITGSALKPELNILEATVKAMVTKTAEYEANKLKDQVTTKVKDEVDREVKKQGKAIADKAEQEAQKLLKNLFK